MRNLEREIASICRKVAREIVTDGQQGQIRIKSKTVEKYLGIPKFRHGETEGKDAVGLTIGLAWTEVGGELLPIEVSTMRGTGKLTLTGKLGDVMQESGRLRSLTSVSRADELLCRKTSIRKSMSMFMYRREPSKRMVHRRGSRSQPPSLRR